MKVAIEVKNRREAECVQCAMADKETRALVLVIGYLLGLKSDRSRTRVLRWVADKIEEEQNNERRNDHP